MSPWSPEVVEVRADTAEGWAHLCREYPPLSGRPICQPEEPVLAVYGRISPTRLGHPAYVRADDAQAIERLREEKRQEAWDIARLVSDDGGPTRAMFSSDADYLAYKAEDAKRQAAMDAEIAAMTPEEIAEEKAFLAADKAAWKAKCAAEDAAATKAEYARLDAIHGPGFAAAREAERQAACDRSRAWIAEGDALSAAREAEEEAWAAEDEEELAEAAKLHGNGVHQDAIDSEIQPEPAVRVRPVTDPQPYREQWLNAANDALDGQPVEVDLAAIPRQPEPHRFIVEDWLPDGVVTLFAAHGGAGKSFIALYIAICVAAGRDVLQAKVERRRVVFYSCEDDEGTLGFRVRRYCDMLKIEPASLKGWLTLIDATASDNVLYTGDARVGDRLTPRFDWLRARVMAARAGLLVLDNASDAYDGNENERGKVRQFLTALRRVAPATLLLAHVDAVTSQHKGVGDGKGYSGSTGWHNSVRARWEGGGKRLGEMDLLLAKSNYGPTGLFASFRFDKVARVWVVGEVRAAVADANENMLAILKLASVVIAGGRGLATGLTANNGPGSLLKLDGSPRGLKPGDVDRVLVLAVQRGYLKVQATRVDSKTKERYEVTDSGRVFLAGGQPARAAS